MSDKMTSNKIPTADQLNVFDPNTDIPSEPPPSYDQSMADPSVPTDISNNYNYNDHQRPSASPPQHKYQRPMAPPFKTNDFNPTSNPNLLYVPISSQTTSSSSSSTSTSYSFPATGSSQQPLPPQRPPIPPGNYKNSSTQTQLPKPTPINPNPYLPWRYPTSYRCSKCENTGFKLKKGKPCKSCWKKYRPGVVPPASQKDLEMLVNHKPAPRPINNNVVKLPPGQVVGYPSYPQGNGPTVVKPGDPRIGGILCPRCNGRGMVHFFLDLERCQTCNGLGRVSFNGRPL